jgi:hypothetical protein
MLGLMELYQLQVQRDPAGKFNAQPGAKRGKKTGILMDQTGPDKIT